MSEMIKETVLEGIDDRFLHEVIGFEQSAKAEKRKVTTYVGKIAACIAIVLGLSFSSLVIAVAAGSMTAYDVLSGIYPEVAAKLMPVKISCDDGGIRMEVEGVSVQKDSAYVYISMQDLEGNRIDDTIDLFDSYSIHTNADQVGNCTLVSYDQEIGKATFLITVQQMGGRPIEGSAMTFSVSKFLSGKVETQEKLTEIRREDISEVSDTLSVDDVAIRGGSYLADSVSKEKVKFLCADAAKSFVPTPGVTVTNYGVINGKLHVQVHYDDILQFDNHGYVYLVDQEGNEVIPARSNSFWDAERKGSYEEYTFDVNEEALADYEIYGHFFTCQSLVSGNWKVRFTISAH